MIGANVPGMTWYGRTKRTEPVTPTTAQPTGGMSGYINTVANKPQAEAQPQPPPPTYPNPTPTSLPQAGQAGSTLQDPGQITGAGKLYAQKVAQNLQGNNPIVQNAQQTEDSAAARRSYTANRATLNSLAQTPFAPGSAQYQRALMESRAGVNAANQAGQNQVNQVTRQATADSMTAAKGLEDNSYANAIGERTNTQLQDSQLGNSIQDPKAKYAFNAMVARGVDPKTAYTSVVGNSGTINSQYQSASPGATSAASKLDEIKSTFKPGVSFTNSNGEQETVPTDPAQYDQWVQNHAAQESVDSHSAQVSPINASNQATEITKATQLENSGKPVTQKQEDLLLGSGFYKEYTPETFPKGQDGKAMVGKKVNIGGTKYTVSGFDRLTQTPIIVDSKGNKKFIWGGKLQDRLPNEKGR